MSHYAELGVPPTATSEEIDEAYEALHSYLASEEEALSGGGSTVTSERGTLEASYAVLSDPGRRADYDAILDTLCVRCFREVSEGSRTCPWCGAATAARPASAQRPAPDSPGEDRAGARSGVAAPDDAPPVTPVSPREGDPPDIRERRKVTALAWALWGLSATVVAALVVVAVAMLSGDGDGVTGDGAEAGSREAVEGTLAEAGSLSIWPEELRPLAGFVQRERGLPFREAVEVELLTSEEFRRALGEDRARYVEDLSAAERDMLRSETGVLRALGLFDGEYDVLARLADPSRAVLGYYDPEGRVVRVASEELTVFAEVTLVHELTHALQDQYFDLGRLREIERHGGLAAFRSLVEGDAGRVETAYLEMLNAEELTRYVEGATEHFEDALSTEGGAGERLDGSGADAPAVYGTYALAPYVLGEMFVNLVATVEGAEAVDEAFHDPPTGDEHVLDPWTYVDGHSRRDVEAPEVRQGDEEVESGVLGGLTWYLLLAERVDPKLALRALDGFGGDAFVTFERGDTVCVRARFQGDTNADNAQMLAALEAWRDAMPEGTVRVERNPAAIDFESCDPGPSVAPVTGRGSTALLFPLVRSGFAVEALAAGATRTEAECAGRGVVDELSIEDLSAMAAALSVGQAPAVTERSLGVFSGCFGPDGPGGDPGDANRSGRP